MSLESAYKNLITSYFGSKITHDLNVLEMTSYKRCVLEYSKMLLADVVHKIGTQKICDKEIYEQWVEDCLENIFKIAEACAQKLHEKNKQWQRAWDLMKREEEKT